MEVQVISKFLNVLIVEDSLLIAKKMKLLLAPLEYIDLAGIAQNYEEAVTILEVIVPDVIILDIQMPGKSGIDLLTEIRLRHMKCRVIVFTNHSDPYFRNLCNQLGADFFLDKSTEFEKIPVLLDYLIQQQAAGL